MRYSAKNIARINEWAIARLDADDHDDAERPEVEDIYEWTRSWLENDPREGGDPWQRRELRPDWPEIQAAAARLGGIR